MANYRNRRLLDLAHGVRECTNCGVYMATGCEPAHENGVGAGKGFGIKSHDNRHAALCHWCHSWYDQGTGMDPSDTYDGTKLEKAEMWSRAHKKTYDHYWSEGLLVVA